jgi:hypothetical protein
MWTIHAGPGGRNLVLNEKGAPVCWPNSDADAALIVQAVNAHKEREAAAAQQAAAE